MNYVIYKEKKLMIQPSRIIKEEEWNLLLNSFEKFFFVEKKIYQLACAHTLSLFFAQK